jgi:hypothetical protein
MLAIRESVKDHLVGLAVIEEMGGYALAAQVIRNKLPTAKRIRSGDLGEILATEYVTQQTDWWVPIKRLRHKDDRNTSMRGTDVVGIRRRTGAATQVLKGEVKSRAVLGAKVVQTATADLLKYSSRPNPSTLAFISSRLREAKRPGEAEIIEDLQMHDIAVADVEHLVFTVSGNDPAAALAAHAAPPANAARRSLVGLIVKDHQAFVNQVFEEAP